MTFNVNLSRISDALERIATSLEQAVPPLRPDYATLRQRGPDAIVKYGDDSKLWMRETFSGMIHERGLAPGQEQEVLDLAMSHALGEDEESEPEVSL